MAVEPWRGLLAQPTGATVAPWIGGRRIETEECVLHVEGDLPPEVGWHEFELKPTRTTRGRGVSWRGPAEPRPEALGRVVRGYLVGDRLVPDSARAVAHDVAKAAAAYQQVHLIDDAGLDRFDRVKAGRLAADGPLVYAGRDMPLGAEEQVLASYLDRKASVNDVPGVPPALDAAFRMETWRRSEAERLRAEAERLRREEDERLVREERLREMTKKLGDAVGRRQMAALDFGEAARAALAVGGAAYLDHRRVGRGEMAVRYRLLGRRFECTCDERTLRIVEAGICLQGHGDDDDDEGIRGDTLFTLESLPGVVQQADREGKLVVFRHVA